MINPGGGYLTAQSARGNHITQKCVIEVGNLALSSQGASAAASSTFSADWPAAGAIDSDVTHINAGAASVADNGVGGAVWQGNILADASGNLGTPEVLTINLGQVRKVNRIKIIWWPSETLSNNLGSIGGDTFLIEYLDPATSAWTPWSGLVDKGSEIGKSATAISAGQVSGNTQDMNVFEDPTARSFQQYRVTVTKLQSGTIRTRVVACEITWAVDVSAYVTRAERKRAKDFHLQRRTATQLNLTLTNNDKRFNDQHVSTTAEVANGFFSDFIRPHLPVRFFGGFSGNNGQMFSGTIETWNPDSKSKNTYPVALDFLKSLIKPTITSNIKQSQYIEALIEYVCNKQNFPTNMMVLDTTTLRVGLFFPVSQSISSVLNDLQDATGDAEIFVDEYGRLLFRNYNTSVSHQYIVQSQADWQSGTLTNIDTLSLPASIGREFFLIDNWADGQYTTNPVWTVVLGSASAATFALVEAGASILSTPFTKATGTWEAKVTVAGSTGEFFISTNLNPLDQGYSVRLTDTAGGTVGLYRNETGPLNTLLGSATGVGVTDIILRMTRDANGLTKVYVNGVLKITATDTNYSSFTYFALAAITSNPVTWYNAYWSPAIDATTAVTNVQAVWTSPVIDRGATVLSLGIVQAIYNAPAGTTVTVQTRSGPTPSPDGSWSAYVTATLGSDDPSPLYQYGQAKIILGAPQDDGLHNADTTTPTVSQLTMTYVAAAGSARSSGTPDWTAADYGLLLGNNRSISSIVNGNNFVFTSALVKASPLVLSPTSVTAWQGTVGNSEISASNPLYVPVGTTTLNVGFGSTSYQVPQTVNITLGTAVATTSLSSHPTNPVLTITVTTAGTITDLTISGYPYVNNAQIIATAQASAFVRQNYDQNIDELENNYIDNVALAQDIANDRMARFGQGALDYIQRAEIRFFPGSQINDTVKVVDSYQEIDTNYYLLSSTDELAANVGSRFTAKTTVELIKVT